MNRLDTMDGRALPLPIDNLDTDQIMPKQFLRIIDRAGLATGLLHDLRFDAHGQLREASPLNDARYRGASFLLGGANFGCGSSREHAVWGLQQYGFCAVIASSFAEIFHSNAVNNRLLPVQLPPSSVAELVHDATAYPAATLRIDIGAQKLTSATGKCFAFPLEARHKRMIVEGIDAIECALARLPEIEAFEKRHVRRYPWARVF